MSGIQRLYLGLDVGSRLVSRASNTRNFPPAWKESIDRGTYGMVIAGLYEGIVWVLSRLDLNAREVFQLVSCID